MKPLVITPGMREGTTNERTVMKTFQSFVEKNPAVLCTNKLSLEEYDMNIEPTRKYKYNLDYLHSLGLVADKRNTLFCDSPDGLCCLNNESVESIFGAIEIKLMTADTTVNLARKNKWFTAKVSIFLK